MFKKVLVMLGVIAAVMAPLMVVAGACVYTYGETPIPEKLKEQL